MGPFRLCLTPIPSFWLHRLCTPPQPPWPPHGPADASGPRWPQGLCTRCSLCCPHFLQVAAFRDHSWSPYLKSSSVQFSLVTQSCPTLCKPMDCSTPGLPVHHHLPELPKLMFIVSVMPSNHLILCRPLLLPSIFPSIRVFSNDSILHIRWQSIAVSASASSLPMIIQD